MKVTQTGFIEGTPPATPPTGIVTLYAKSTGVLYSKDDMGVETQLGTPGTSPGTVTDVTSANADLTIVDNSTTPVITVVQTPALRSATTTVNVSSATAPTTGQVLTATGASAATWQNPASSGTVTSVTSANADITVATTTTTPVLTMVQAPALRSATTTVNVSSATAPSSGQVLTATSSTAATWQTPAVSGTNPKFSAYPSSNAGYTGGATATVAFDTEEFDTNTDYASNAFTPTVAGYYLILATVHTTGTGSAASQELFIRKNGSTSYSIDFDIPIGSEDFVGGSRLINFNGSSDYVEVRYFSNDNRTIIGGVGSGTYFQGFKVA